MRVGLQETNNFFRPELYCVPIFHHALFLLTIFTSGGIEVDGSLIVNTFLCADWHALRQILIIRNSVP